MAVPKRKKRNQSVPTVDLEVRNWRTGNSKNLTPEIRDEFLDRLIKYGGNHTRALEGLGVARRTIVLLRKNDPGFKKDYDEAMEMGVEILEDEARRRGFEGIDKPIYQGGRRVGLMREYSDSTLHSLLKAHHPKYQDVRTVKLGGFNDGPVELSAGLKAIFEGEMKDASP